MHAFENLKANMSMIQDRVKSGFEPIPFQSVIDSCPAGIYWKDLDGKFLGCNQATLDFLKMRDRNQVIGKTDYDLHSNRETAQYSRDMDERVVRSDCARLERRDFHNHNGMIYLSYKAPLRDDNGNIYGVSGVSIDITSSEKTERRLQQIFDLADAFDAKDRFLRNISHEIRIPLQGILSLPQGLKDNFHRLTDEEKLQYLDTLVNANERLMSLMSNLLDLSKFRENKLTMNLVKEDMLDIVRDVIDEFEVAHGDIRLHVEGESFGALCDKYRVAQLIRNLIANSIRHGGKNDPIDLYLSHHKENGENYIKFGVKDKGVGIPRDERIMIFQAFVESTRTRKESGGVGLGLSIAKEIIKAHKGRIWAEDLHSGEKGALIYFLMATQM